MTDVQSLIPEQVVQHNLDCYNNKDIEGFMTSLSDNIELYNFAEDKPVMVGLDAFKEFYGELFKLSPNLHSTVVNRIVFDNKVIDHETIIGRKGSDTAIELVMIYEVQGKKISRMTVLRE
ncbi:hypothetical protein GTQ40_04315 [Flavobacteriaceae bacterium R38]|nr:hypothetical protein [Flavobacteriaceae bacterium R38]